MNTALETKTFMGASPEFDKTNLEYVQEKETF